MTRQEYVESLVKVNYQKYNIKLPWNKLPWSGELIDTKLNDGKIELVDRMVEFTLCSLYSFYFIDRYCFTIDPIKGPIPLKLFDFQINILDSFQKKSKIIFRKARQIGATVVTGCYALWRANFHKGQNVKIISLNQTDAIELKEKTIDINYEEMPGFLKSKSTRDGDSKTKLKLLNKSQIRVLTKSKNAGRGGTPSLVIIDEAAFNEWMDDIWKSILPSLDKGGSCIIISTTNGVGNFYHLTYTRAEQGLNQFHPIYIPWWRYPGRDNPWLQDILDNKIEDIQKLVIEKEREALSYEGDPLKAPWLWKMRADSKTDKDFQQEILAQFLGTGETVITGRRINQLDLEIEEPQFIDRLPQNDGSISGLWIWEDVKPGVAYAMSCDVAKGSNKDFSVFHIYDIYENKQVGEYKNLISTNQFGKLIKQVAEYYNYAYVIIETSGLGIAVFNEVYLVEDGAYQNVYISQKGKILMGWETTLKTRPLLIDDFFNNIENKITKMVSRRFIEEVKTFNWSESGKAEALSGYNDDLVLAHAIYCHLRDFVLSSKPMGISNYRTSSADMNMEIEEMKWSDKDNYCFSEYNMNYGDWCWMVGKNVEPEYAQFIQNKRKEKDDEEYDIIQ